MKLWIIMVPTIRNNPIGKNKYYTLRYHKNWDKKVLAITGGLTIMKPVRGQWISPDKTLFVERMIEVKIYCSEEQMEEIANFTAKYYDQIAIMYYKISDDVKIKYYK